MDASCYAQLTVSLDTAQFSNLRKHAMSKRHKEAAAAHLRAMSPGDAAEEAPSEQGFLALWHELGNRSSSTQSSMKRNTMEWCLLQALRDEERPFLCHAKSISIALDERKGRWLLMFTACNGLEVRTGVLGAASA